MEYQAKLNEKYMPVLHCISSFEDTSSKKLQGTTTSSYLLFYISFYILRYHFLQLFWASFDIIWEKTSSWMFLFKSIYLNPPCSCNYWYKNLLSMTNHVHLIILLLFFVNCKLFVFTLLWVFWLYIYIYLYLFLIYIFIS